jgi:hypothetical protein
VCLYQAPEPPECLHMCVHQCWNAAWRLPCRSIEDSCGSASVRTAGQQEAKWLLCTFMFCSGNCAEKLDKVTLDTTGVLWGDGGKGLVWHYQQHGGML